MKNKFRLLVVKLTVAQKNLIANFAGQGVSAVLGIILVPVYLHFISVEGYGLIAFFSTLVALFSFLNLGMNATVNREMARLKSHEDSPEAARNLIFSVQLIYVAIGSFVGLLWVFASGWIAEKWLHGTNLSITQVHTNLLIMAAVFTIRWPLPLYQGTLRGLERQVLLNLILILTGLVRGIGALIVVIFISGTVRAFFLWQLAAGIFELITLSISAWRCLPPSEARLKFDARAIKGLRHFALFVAGADILGIIIQQSDKLLVSKLLPLGQLGYYGVATSLAGALMFAVLPFAYTFYPRFSALFASTKENELKQTYRLSSQLVAMCICTAAGVLIFFSYDILLIWSRSVVIARDVSITLIFLTIGFFCQCLYMLPKMLQYAVGIPKIHFFVSLAGALFLPLAIYGGINRMGLSGAALSWALWQLLIILTVPHIMHRSILRDEKWNWYRDNLKFLIPGLGIPCLLFLISRKIHVAWGAYIFPVTALLSGYLFALLIHRPSRDFLAQFYRSRSVQDVR